MDAHKKGWFNELNELWPGVSLALQIDEVVHTEKSNYQDIMVFKSKSHGNVLVLDGIIQCTEFDEFAYQEMISFLPLCSHPCPKKVLIVGGGDGGVAREVCKHPDVVEVYQVEIDAAVMRVCKQYIPSMGQGLTNPKVRIFVDDGLHFITEHKNEFDVIITDSSDPVGPAICLFQNEYFRAMKNALRDGGIICSQAGTPWANLDIVCSSYKICRNVFPQAAFAYASVPTYPTGQIGFVLGSKNEETNFREPLKVFRDDELDKMKLKYYTPRIHAASFVLPKFVEDALERDDDKKSSG